MTDDSQKIQKDKVYTLIRTTCETIEGMIFKDPDNRMLDSLNLSTGDFIPVTDVTVYSAPDKKLLFKTDFMAVNKSHIVLISQQKRIPFDLDIPVKPTNL